MLRAIITVGNMTITIVLICFQVSVSFLLSYSYFDSTIHMHISHPELSYTKYQLQGTLSSCFKQFFLQGNAVVTTILKFKHLKTCHDQLIDFPSSLQLAL